MTGSLVTAIYNSTSLVEHYDFLEEYGEGNPADKMQGGEGSFGYAQGVCAPGHLVCELPYFYDERIGDTSPTETSRKDAILQGIERTREITGLISDLYDRIGDQLTITSQFLTASEHLTKLIVAGTEAKRAWAETNQDLDVPATAPQAFDNLTVGWFCNLLIVGMARRALELENENALTPQVAEALAEVEERFATWASQLEEDVDYRVIPIKTLVEIQLGAALHCIDAL